MENQLKKDININMQEMDNCFFLIGLLNEFVNRFQAVADHLFEEMSWKQCFALICIGLFAKPPTLKELSELLGSSHQNIKQILNKLYHAGYVEFLPDEKDGRKQRIITTKKTEEFQNKHDRESTEYMKQLFCVVDDESLKITVQTIMKLDTQLKKMQKEDKKERE